MQCDESCVFSRNTQIGSESAMQPKEKLFLPPRNNHLDRPKMPTRTQPVRKCLRFALLALRYPNTHCSERAQSQFFSRHTLKTLHVFLCLHRPQTLNPHVFLSLVAAFCSCPAWIAGFTQLVHFLFAPRPRWAALYPLRG